MVLNRKCFSILLNCLQTCHYPKPRSEEYRFISVQIPSFIHDLSLVSVFCAIALGLFVFNLPRSYSFFSFNVLLCSELTLSAFHQAVQNNNNGFCRLQYQVAAIPISLRRSESYQDLLFGVICIVVSLSSEHLCKPRKASQITDAKLSFRNEACPVLAPPCRDCTVSY